MGRMARMPEERPTAVRGSYPKGVARRQEILDRAIEVFARRGSDRTSLRAIADEVGVTHAALRHYFGSLEELLVAVYRESERHDGPDDHKDPEATPIELVADLLDENGVLLVDADPGAPSTIDGSAR